MPPKLLPEDELGQTAVEGMFNATMKTCNMIEALASDVTAEELAMKLVTRILAHFTAAAGTDSVNVAIANIDEVWHAHIHLGYLDADPQHVLDATARD